jgi:uncharacterized protein YndB with AHSA1/START domain
MTTATDRIEREIMIKAKRSRVWSALTNADEFGKWFGVAFKNVTFAAGKKAQGQIVIPGFEHVVFDVVIERLEPEHTMSWRWHPYAVDPAIDYDQEESTLVVFDLQEVEGGTLLKVVESGFDKVPPGRRLEAFRMNSNGWEGQLRNIDKHVTAS